jgi:hypothetical protein
VPVPSHWAAPIFTPGRRGQVDKEAILTAIADVVARVCGFRFEGLKAAQRMRRAAYEEIYRDSVETLYGMNPDFLQGFEYANWKELAEELEPFFHENVKAWNKENLEKPYSDGVGDSSEFFEDAESVILRQQPEHRKDLWRGLAKTFGPSLYELSEKYKERVKSASHYFLEIGLAQRFNDAEGLVIGLHYKAFHENVMAIVDRRSDKPENRTLADLTDHYLRNKARTEENMNDVASFIGYKRDPVLGLLDLPMQLEVDGQETASSFVASDLAEVLRQRVEEGGGEMAVRVLELMLSGEELKQKVIAERLGRSTSTINEHFGRIRQEMDKLIREE